MPVMPVKLDDDDHESGDFHAGDGHAFARETAVADPGDEIPSDAAQAVPRVVATTDGGDGDVQPSGPAEPGDDSAGYGEGRIATPTSGAARQTQVADTSDDDPGSGSDADADTDADTDADADADNEDNNDS